MMMRTKSFWSTGELICTMLHTIQNRQSQVFVCVHMHGLWYCMCPCDGGQKLLRTHDSLIKCQQKYFHVFIFDVDFALNHSEWEEYFCFVHSSIVVAVCLCTKERSKRRRRSIKHCTIVSSASPFGLMSSIRGTIPRARLLFLVLDWYQRLRQQ